MHGVPLASHWSETGLVVSGVEPTAMMSTPSPRIRSEAASAAALGSEALSASMISIGCTMPPMSRPSESRARMPDRTNSSASANPASGPVLGDTKPTFTARPAAGADGAAAVVGAAVPAAVVVAPPEGADSSPQAPTTSPAPAAAPSADMNCRRVCCLGSLSPVCRSGE